MATTEDIKQALIEAGTKLREQQDYIEAVKGEPIGYGIVLKIGKIHFSPSDFKKGSHVRIIEGPFSGKMGTVVDFNLSQAELIVKPYRSKQKIGYQIFRDLLDLPDLKIEDQIVESQEASDFTIGATVVDEDGDEFIIMQDVDEHGKIVVMDRYGDTEEIFVGKQHKVAPMGVSAGTVEVLCQGRVVVCNIPRDFKLQVGDAVNLSLNTFQIVGKGSEHTYGSIGYVKKKIDGAKIEVETDQGFTKIVYNLIGNSLEEGNRVSLDISNQAALLLLPEAKVTVETKSTGVQWDDIGGQEDAKRQLIEAIEWPVRYKELYEKYGKKSISGVLLYGPPGTGKTMFGKAAATAIAELHGTEAVSTGFIFVKGPELLNQFVGATEAAIRQMFASAKKHKIEHGYPAVIFIDEAESILSKRGSGISSDMEKTVVPQFLTEMNGLEESGALVILATNRPDTLDPAIVREQRIDRKIKVGRPNREEAMHILGIYLTKVPLQKGLSLAETVDKVAHCLFDDRYFYGTASLNDGKEMTLYLRDTLSGAMLATLVDTATSYSINRDVANGNFSGVCAQDIIDAVEFHFQQNKSSDKESLVEPFLDGRLLRRFVEAQ